MKLRKFKKRPIVIEAYHWLGKKDIDLFFGDFKKWSIDYDDYTLSIETLEGVHEAGLGDWIIKGIAGEFYPCKCHIFLDTYDEVFEVVEE